MVKPLVLSPTMVDVGRLCLRKLAFRYCSNLPKPPAGKGAELGSGLHFVGERYLQAGIKPDRGEETGRMLLAGLPYLPPPKSGVVEGHSVIKVSGFTYQLYLDWQGRSDDLPGAPPGLPATLDHKTSKDPKKYGIGIAPDKAPEDDSQTIIYSAKHLIQDKTAPAVFNRWLYYKTGLKKPKVFPSDCLLTRAQTEDGFATKIHPTAVKILPIWNERPDPNEVEPSAGDSCDAFGGCPYAEARQGPCQLTNTQKLTGMKEGHVMGMLEDLRAKKAAADLAAGGTPPPAPAINPPPGQPSPVAAAVGAQVASTPPPAAAIPADAPAQVAQAKAARKTDMANRDAIANRLGLALLDFADYLRG